MRATSGLRLGMTLEELIENAKNSPRLGEMTREEFDAEMAAKSLPDHEIDRLCPHIHWMRARAREAIQDLQAKGILDQNGRLIPPAELPPDMRPESTTEC